MEANTTDTVDMNNEYYFSKDCEVITSMNTVVTIPDLRIKLDDGSIHFMNIKELSPKQLFRFYEGFTRVLRQIPNIIVNRDGDIIGVKE